MRQTRAQQMNWACLKRTMRRRRLGRRKGKASVWLLWNGCEKQKKQRQRGNFAWRCWNKKRKSLGDKRSRGDENVSSLRHSSESAEKRQACLRRILRPSEKLKNSAADGE